MPPKFRLNFQCALLRNSVHLSSFSYGTITLCHAPFQATSDQKTKTKNRSCNTTSPCCFQQDSVCRLLCSLAVTNSSSIDFFSFGYCDVSLPRVKGSHEPLRRARISFRYLWFNGCMRLARAFRSLPRPSSPLEPSHPSNGTKTYIDLLGSFALPMHDYEKQTFLSFHNP